jgi:arabinofuranan 3-O-arabinosyltransferase
LATVAVVLLTLVLNLVQQPGLVTFDTKLDLQFAPADFLARSLGLWNGDSAVGGLQNQASGYLFPMGPIFWLGTVLDVPMWIWERLWSAAVMLVAYEGARRLASRWPGIGAWGAVVAGLTYMLAPRILMTVGGLSGETLPAAVLPWTVLPLLLYLLGHVRARVAFLWSAATVPLMGGQNATLVVACLLLPGLLLVLVEGRRWSRRLLDAVAWTSLVTVACLWWLLPLILMGSYAPPFLDFIESSHNTASSIGWLTSLRGTSHWVAFFPGGGTSGWAGAYDLVSSSVLLVTTALAAGAGLLGLALPGLWARRALLVTALVGLVILTLGHGGWSGSLLSDWWLELLDGSLAPLRNVHKFDPVVRLPLSLGVGALISVGLPALVARIPDHPHGRPRLVQVGAVTVVVGGVLAAALPAVAGNLRVEDGMHDISSSWRQAAAFLESQDEPVKVLVLPGSGFAVQEWGRTIDEPIQVLDTPPWLARAQVTVAPGGTLRQLDSLEDAIEQGRPLPALADQLRRLGITHVVVRNDLDLEVTDAPSPDVVYASLAGAYDVDSVATFGRVVQGHPQVEVFEVEDGGEDPRIAGMDWDDRTVVQGGPEVVDGLVSAGLVDPGQATVLATDPDQAVDIVTDSNQRVERSFGRVHDATSALMTADEPFRVPRRVHNYTSDEIPAAQTTAEYDGAALVTASSSGGYADILGPVRPEQAPYAAFDDSGLTAWVSEPLSSPVGQWIEARFTEYERLGTVNLWFDTTAGAAVTEVRLRTDAGVVTVPVGEDGRAAGVELPDGVTRFVRMNVVAAHGNESRVRLLDFDIAGHDIRRSARVPGEITSGTSVYLAAEAPRRACIPTEAAVSCVQGRAAETPESTGFDRTIDVGAPVRWQLEARAVATHGLALDALLAPLSGRFVSLTATSAFAGDPAVAAANAYDGRGDTSWFASPLDVAPALQLSWRNERTIREVLASLSPGAPGQLPSVLVVDPMTEGVDPQLVNTSGSTAGEMTPVRTNRLRIGVLPDSVPEEGVGISELHIQGLGSLRYGADPAATTGLMCGFGPTIEIGGVSVETRVTGTIADVLDGGELHVEPCGSGQVDAQPGVQRARVTNPPGFAVTRLWLTPVEADGVPIPTPSQIDVTAWGATDRRVEVQTSDDLVLTVPESHNRGWTAAVDGTRLSPVVVDGWRQGWQVPGGTSGEVHLEFAPQRGFVASIVIGLVLAALLQLVAVLTLMTAGLGARFQPAPANGAHAAEPPTAAMAGALRWGLAGLSVVFLAAVSVPLAVGAVGGYVLRRSWPAWSPAVVGVGLAAAVVVTIAGAGTPVKPSSTSDVIVALLVGSICGAVLGRRDAGGREPW